MRESQKKFNFRDHISQKNRNFHLHAQSEERRGEGRLKSDKNELNL